MDISNPLDTSFESTILLLSPLPFIQDDINGAFEIYESQQTRPTWVKKTSRNNSNRVNTGITSAIQSKRRFERELPEQVVTIAKKSQLQLSSSLIFSFANLNCEDTSRPLFFKTPRARLSQTQRVERIKRQMNFAAKYAEKNWSRGLSSLTFRVNKEECFWVYFYYLCEWINKEHPDLSKSFKDTFQSSMVSLAAPGLKDSSYSVSKDWSEKLQAAANIISQLPPDNYQTFPVRRLLPLVLANHIREQ